SCSTPVAEPVAHVEYLLGADVDAAPACGAVAVQDDGMVLARRLERRPDYLGFGADGVAVHAVVAPLASGGIDAQQGAPAQQPIERAYRAYMAAPSARRNQQVVHRDDQHQRQRGSCPDLQGAMQNGTGLDPYLG